MPYRLPAWSRIVVVLLGLWPALAAETRVDETPTNFGISEHQIVTVAGGFHVIAWIQDPPLGGDPSLIQVFSRRDLGGGVLGNPVRVNTTPAVANFSNLRLLASGNHVYAVWERVVRFSPALTELRFNHSADGGETWELDRAITPQTVDASGGSALAIGPLQDVYVAFSGNVGGGSHIFFARSTNHGVDWGALVHVDRSPSGSTRPAMAADQGSSVVILWHDLRGGASVFANSSDDRGDTFQSSDTAVSPLEPLGIEVVPGGAGRFYSAFEVSTGSRFEAHASASSDGGKSWEAPIRIDGSDAGIEIATLRLSSSGNGHVHTTVVYKLAGTSGLFYRGSDDEGHTFRRPVRLDGATSTTEEIFPDIAAGSGGLVLACWAQLTNGTSPGFILARISVDFGQTWSERILVSGKSSVQRVFPEVSVDPISFVGAVAWQEGTAPMQKLFFGTLSLR